MLKTGLGKAQLLRSPRPDGQSTEGPNLEARVYVTSLFSSLSSHFTEGKIRSRKDRRWLVQSQTVDD